MASLPEAAVVARISLIVLLAVGRASAQSSDADIIGHEPGPHVEDVTMRASVIDQHGHGYQSQDGTTPGSEAMTIFEPAVLFTIRQSDRVVHEVSLPFDFISAASPDAVDATTSASRRNESGDIDVRTAIKMSDRDTLLTRFAAHVEEPMGSGTIGGGWRRSFADDNAAIAATASFTFDVFDDHDHIGTYLGKTARETSSLNVTASQLLSPTTVLDGSYGITYQHGTLRTGWNAVPVPGVGFADELVPHDRVRNVVTARIAQHVPWTRSTFKVWYRAYHDDFGITAHTAELDAYQYLVAWLYVRVGYRYYHQSGADFFTTGLAAQPPDGMLRTSDSDLAPFSANEWSAQLAIVRGRAPNPLRDWSLSAELFHYARSNDLQITAVSLTIGKIL